MTNQTTAGSFRRSNTYAMTMIALMTAVTCILAPLSIPIGPVPISLTNFAIYLSLYLLDWKKGTISYFIYLLLGFAGLPVFSGFTGGVAKLAGPTGGYIVGFIPMAIIAGFAEPAVFTTEVSTAMKPLRYISGMVSFAMTLLFPPVLMWTMELC